MYLNYLGAKNGIGRVDMVENCFVGIKSRGIYESPGMTILHLAHRDIEGIARDREVMRLRDMLSSKFAELVYYGVWYSPEMDFLMAAINKSQELTTALFTYPYLKAIFRFSVGNRLFPFMIKLYRAWTLKASSINLSPLASLISTPSV